MIGVLLIIGVTISYVLQFVRIIQLQSSQVIAPFVTYPNLQGNKLDYNIFSERFYE